MAEYTYKDVIIDPEDPRVEIGKEYYRADYSKRVLHIANNDEDYIGTLEKIDTESPETPFVVKTGGAYSPWACIIRKKEPEKKYVPFDLSDPDVRKSLRGVWLISKEGREEMITAFHTLENGKWTADMSNFANATGDGLLRFYTFEDGTPCGKLVEEE